MSKIKAPRFMLAAPSSGSGKTMITCGILQALARRDLNPSAFKCGPDYIDPMFHGKVMGLKSKNLDLFFSDENQARYLMAKESLGSKISVIEGVMGYYDGMGVADATASSYDLARKTKTPTILILDTKGMSLSIIPMIQGFMNYQSDSNIVGVILNKMNKMLFDRMKPEIEKQLGIKAVGYVPKDDKCAVESRHLGLVTPDEIKDIRERLDRLAVLIEECVDLDLLLEIAGKAPDLEFDEPKLPLLPGYKPREASCESTSGKVVRIALADDEAFCFNYRDNLELLESMGAELVRFSPIRDEKLPDNIQGLILYGGYPEVYAEQLEANTSMINDIRSKIEEGLPYLAECGGFMYLHESMEDMNGNKHKMVGVIKGEAYKTNKLGRFGYISLKENKPGILGLDEFRIQAHEFHYFDSTSNGEDIRASKPTGNRGWDCIHATDKSLAGFPHLYYYSNPEIIYNFLRGCMK